VTRAVRAPRSVRRTLVAAFDAAIAVVDPIAVARAALTVTGTRLVARGGRGRATLPLRHGVVVIGAGKGAAGLAAGVETVLGESIVDGVVIVPAGYARRLARVRLALGSHPMPDARSLRATRQMLAVLERHPDAAVLVLLTGGASSLLAAPAPGLTVADARRAGAWLLASGADIARMNAVRKHLSAVTGGRLAARLVGRPAAALVVSDVPGDDLAVIGSGPTVADPTTFADALAVVDRRGVGLRVHRHLARGAAGRVAETPKPGSRAARACPTLLVAGNATAQAGVARWARAHGIARVVRLRRPVVGDGAAAARRLAEAIRRARAVARGPYPTLIVGGGETTVRLDARSGRGGRNQELASAVAAELAGEPGWAILCAGTDGIDGPTRAAGAFADGATAARARRVGRPLADALSRHDVHPCLASLGDLFAPGPTGTNVADLTIALAWKDRGWRLPGPVLQPTSRR
jgi:glycerate 2-kinase